MCFSFVRGKKDHEKENRNQDSTLREKFFMNFMGGMKFRIVQECKPRYRRREKKKEDFLRQILHVVQKIQLRTRVHF